MPEETIDQSGVEWICHTSTEHARHILKRANQATCEKCLDELDHHARADAGRKPRAHKTLRARINARLCKLAKGKEAA